MKSIKIKVCGMKDPSNIQALGLLNIDYMGFIFFEGSKRFVDKLAPLDIPLIPAIQRVGVFVNSDFRFIQEKIKAFELQVIQLHGNETLDLCRKVRDSGVTVIKAFGIDSEFDWSILPAYVPFVDYFLFDTKSNQHGGTGTAFDWHILENYNLQVPYFLSGGIGPHNIHEALQSSDPRLYAVDLNSKFESAPGLKDIELLKKVVKTIQHEQISS